MLALLNFPTHAANLFAYKSEPGDYVGGGQSNSYDETQAQFNLHTTQSGINFFLNNKKSFWSAELSASTSEKLEARTYRDATRFPTGVNAGIDVGGEGRGCNSISGEFKVLNVVYDNDTVTSLALDFVQHCENAKDALYGAIRYNSSIPNDLDDYIKSLVEKTDMVFFSAPGDWIGGGKFAQFSREDKAYQIRHYNKNVVSIYYNAQEDWLDLDFAAPQDHELIPGFYDHATRYPFQDKTVPGLDIGGNGRGCNEMYGQFKVLEANYNEKGEVKNLAIDFIQHCESMDAAPLTGAIRYHSQIPINISLPGELKNTALDLPYVKIADHYNHVKFSLTNQNPVIFKVDAIDNTAVKADEIRVASSFNSFDQVLFIPLINVTDIFGKVHVVENIKLKSQYGGFHVGDTFTLDNNTASFELIKFLKLK
jgi:hypothetical protein